MMNKYKKTKIMNNLAILRKIVFTFFAMLIAAFSWGQDPTPTLVLQDPSSPASETNPYVITSATDWNTFASDVNGGYSYSGEYVKLTANITLTINNTAGSDLMAGEPENTGAGLAVKWFSGTFDGDWHTMTFNVGTSQNAYAHTIGQNEFFPSSPFRVIDGATIKNLTVDGSIYSDNKYNSGFVGYAHSKKTKNTNYIQNCTSSIYIDCSNILTSDHDCTSAGFLAAAKEQCKIVLENCIFNGTIDKGSLQGSQKSAGFISYNSGSSLTYTNCTMDGTITVASNIANFSRGNNPTFIESYYTKNNYGGQGAQAPTTPPSDKFAKKYIYGATTYYVPGVEISGFETTYLYEGSPLEITPVVKYYGKTLTRGTDYIVKIDGTEIPTATTPTITIGYHTVTIEGVDGSDYAGSQPTTVHVIEKFSGDGTAASPYLISNASDWADFTEEINYGIGVDKYYKLENDITLGTSESPINTVVGSGENSDRRFKGHFDGNWKTIEIYLQREDQKYAAPFGVIEDAVIENLAVTGKIKTNQQFAGGIAAYTYGTVTIRNCISSVEIDCSDIVQYPTASQVADKQYDCTHGGLVGQLQSGTLRFINCIFNGSILDKKSTKTARKCAGFCGWRGGTIQYTDCTMAGTIDIADVIGTFFLEKSAGSTTLTNAYYITPSGQGDDQGTEIATSAAPTDGIYRKYTVSANNYYVQGGVTPSVVSTATYSYTGSPISIDPFVITYYGWTLVKGTDYQIVYEYSATGSEPYGTVSEINAAGHYRISIVGTNNYGGSKVIYEDLEVISLTSWPNLKRAMATAKADLTLTQDLADTDDDGALVVSGTIVLDLNGHIINRKRTSMEDDGYVIKVEADANLTINDSNPSATHTGVFASLTGGIITGGKSYGNGGGIYNDRGTLTLNDVTVYNNTSELTGGGIYCAAKSENKYSRFYMTGGAIRNNKADGISGTAAGGGGIYANTVAAFQMDNVTVTENNALSKGGGIRLAVENNVQTSISNCNIADNEIRPDSESKGGGIHYSGNNLNAKLTITNSRIQGNEVTREGGGIFILKGTVELNNCTLEGNIASRYNNTGSVRGGGVCVYDGALIMDGSTITNNQCYHQGGGVYVYSGKTMQIKGDVQIIGNTSTNYEAENVYLAGGSDVIEVIGDITGANIGISKDVNGTITSGLGSYGTEDNFTADISNKCVMLYEGEAYLQNYYTWGVTSGWPALDGIYVEGNNYDITAAVVDIPNETTIAPPTAVALTGASMLIIEDGAQLIPSSALSPVIVKKNIEAALDAGENTYGWYTIASPVNDAVISTNTTLKTTNSAPYDYDLMMYDEPDHYWRSYRSETASTYFAGDLMVNGRGYLYRNANNVTVEFTGPIHSGDVTCSVTNSDDLLPGFNLIGNPFTHNITFGNISLSAGDALTGGYVLDKAGSWGAILAADATVKPCQGVLVQVSKSATATIRHTASGAKANKDFISFTVANGTYEDVAYALFDEGCGLSKIEHMNEDVPMVYINYKDENYGIATFGDAVKAFNLNFQAKTTGIYTLGYEAEGEFDYLHVIDCLTGEDIDILAEGSYSFIGSPRDAEARFIVRLQENQDNGDGVFAYQNGNDIVLSGEGELQVYDVMGRFVTSQRINGVETINLNANGVYILRLIGNEIKTQKIVVR